VSQTVCIFTLSVAPSQLLVTVVYFLWVSKFSWRCSWGFRSSRIWIYVTGQSDTDVSKEHFLFTFHGR